MKTMLNLKIDKELKEKAQNVTNELGLSLSSVVSNYLKDMVNDGQITFSLTPKPNESLEKILSEADKNRSDKSYWSSVSSVDELMEDLNS